MKTILISLVLAFQILNSYAAVAPVTATSSCKFSWPQVFDVEFKQTGDRIQIEWKAVSESADLYYIIEKSENGTTFSTAGLVMGGFDQQQHYSYQFRDKRNTKTKTYYQIKQMSNDGTGRVVSEQLL